MSDEKQSCQKCNEELDGEGRTLWMACFYDMMELKLPFEKKSIVQGTGDIVNPFEKYYFYTLRVCKDCRADWMKEIKHWFETPKKADDDVGTGIFIREFGKTKEITRAEWDKKFMESRKNEDS